MFVCVVTADQRASRRSPDHVEQVLLDLARTAPLLRVFERTAGDEVQGVLDDAAGLAPVLERLLREGIWSVGLGLGRVETPLPDHSRAGRGEAYVHARSAVDAAKSAPWPVRVVTGPSTPTDGTAAAARALEAAVWLWASVLARRTRRGWEVADLLDGGHTYTAVAGRLGISQSAVSQRARAAGVAEAQRARGLVAYLGARALLAGREES